MHSPICIQVLRKFLSKRVSDRYVLLDLPYYSNVGDVLIWKATEEVILSVGRCVYSASIETYRKCDIHIDETVPILFMGGGNWGDVWIRHQKFRWKVLEDFPNNPIIQLPQSVCFKDESILRKDVDMFSKHKGKVDICLRDKRSYKFIQDHYQGVECHLLPDMVLSLDLDSKYKSRVGNGAVLVQREDKEKAEGNIQIDELSVDVRDWPSMETGGIALTRIEKYLRKAVGLLPKTAKNSILNAFYKRYYKERLIKSGIDFLSKYEVVYSTRLHAGILAALLGKKVRFIDNSYSKISGVYDEWMTDWDNCEMIWTKE